MKISEVLNSIKSYDTYDDVEVSLVTADSRKIVPGCIFVCIRGNSFDGHDVAAQALESGAVLVVCDHDLGLDKQVVVENTRAAFSVMCANFFGNPATKLKLIGITGTNGKTTTAFLMKNMLEKCKNITYTENNVKIISALNEESRTQLEKLADECQLPMVATNDCHYLRRENAHTLENITQNIYHL